MVSRPDYVSETPDSHWWVTIDQRRGRGERETGEGGERERAEREGERASWTPY